MSFIALTIITFLLISLYLGWRFRWAFAEYLPGPLRHKLWLYWLVFIILIAVFPIIYFRIWRLMGETASPGLMWFSTMLFGAIILTCTTTAVIDVACLIIRKVGPLRRLCKPLLTYFAAHHAQMGLLVLFLAALHTGWAWQRADTPRATHFSVHIDKPLPAGVEQLRIVQLSDTHIKPYTSTADFAALVEKINALNPDLVVLTGDIIDRSLQPFIPFTDIFRKLNARYGVFAVLGNHEYFSGSIGKVVEAYQQAGMQVLRDQAVWLAEPGITIVGRNDKSQGSNRFMTGNDPEARQPRLALSDLMAGVDKSHPLLLLDHQPFNLDEVEEAGVDIEFSGHTHYGQFFPLNLVVKAIYENPWGMLKKDSFTSIVSCGLGTWGPPLRLPSYAEYVVVDIYQMTDYR